MKLLWGSPVITITNAAHGADSLPGTSGNDNNLTTYREIIMAQLKKPLAAALGAAFLASSIAPLASAGVNPFSAQQLNGGYDLVNFGKDAEGKCGEGKCGGDKSGEGSCGENKAGEGSCGGDKAGEGSCGENKAGEGSCGGDKAGEGSCGGDKAGEGSCGGDESGAAKSGEGKCGEGKCGGS
jgi:uncharacterized low-complexity protein